MVDPGARIGLEKYNRVVVLTGAGISVASGLRPFRGPGGLWTEEGNAVFATPKAFEDRPAGAWKLFGELRAQALAAEPNAAHLALADAERRLAARGAELLLVTQNVDRLHARAGSKNVVELHGMVFRTRCSRSGCDLAAFDDEDPHADAVPTCPRCGSVLRPDVVLFEEMIPVDAERRVKTALRDVDLFIAIGTSGTVSPASNFVRSADLVRARTVLVNLEPLVPRNRLYDDEYLGRAEEILPQLLA